MICRKPVVAGRFYPADKNDLQRDIRSFLNEYTSEKKNVQPAWAVMLPHAGYVFCGNIIARTLAGALLPERLVILCPNHTGYGRPLGVWSNGCWETPLGIVEIDAKLASEIIATDTGFEPDTASHMAEHSIEVLLPFLQTLNPNLSIVPICVGIKNKSLLERAATGLAEVIKEKDNVGIIVSSDMNHYESHARTLAKDQLALDQIFARNPAGLLETVERNNISMCGAAPMALALFTAARLGKYSVHLTGHTTSGPVSGDLNHTVGYAGLVVEKI